MADLLLPSVGTLRKGKRGAEPSRFCAPLLYNCGRRSVTPPRSPGNARAPVEIFPPARGLLSLSCVIVRGPKRWGDRWSGSLKRDSYNDINGVGRTLPPPATEKMLG